MILYLVKEFEVYSYSFEEILSLNACTLALVYLDKAIDEIKPVKFYSDFKKDRISLIRDNSRKTGVYYIINLINGHDYIGSSSNLASRMRNYLNKSCLINYKNKICQ